MLLHGFWKLRWLDQDFFFLTACQESWGLPFGGGSREICLKHSYSENLHIMLRKKIKITCIKEILMIMCINTLRPLKFSVYINSSEGSLKIWLVDYLIYQYWSEYCKKIYVMNISSTTVQVYYIIWFHL